MKMCLVGMLCLALLCGTVPVLAEEVSDIELVLDEVQLDEAADYIGDEPALELEAPEIDALQPEQEETVEARQNDAFASNSNAVVKKYITYELVGDEMTVVSANAKKLYEAIIPDELNGYPVTRIADGAFAGCTKLWHLVIPDSVTEIGESAFSGCTDLNQVEIADSVKKIGAYAFKDCGSIYHLVLPESLTKIHSYTFKNCINLWKIKIPETVEVIDTGAFYGCVALKTVNLDGGGKSFKLPDSLETLGESALEGCTAITSLTIPNGVTEINDRTFKDCTELRKITLHDNLTTIGNEAFRNCDSLRKLTLPDGLKKIGKLAFAYCKDLETLKIPGSVDKVGYGAFSFCNRLEQVTIEPGVSKLKDYCFAQCKALKKVAIPESVTYIGEYAFKVGASAGIYDGKVALSAPQKNPKKLKLYGRPDSTAQAHAKDNGITFVVQKIKATSVSIAQGASMTLYVGQTAKLKAIQKPSNAETTVSWKSDSSSVSVSKDGTLTPKHAGKATITAKTENGKTAKIVVKVIDAKTVKILEGKTLSLKVGDVVQLHASVTPEKVTTKLTWKSKSKKIASVGKSSGLVVAHKKGTTYITVKTANGKSAKIKVKVSK